jgi:hypothetical protein
VVELSLLIGSYPSTSPCYQSLENLIKLHVYTYIFIDLFERERYDKRIDNDLQNITQKTKDRVTRTSLRTEGKFSCSGMESSSCSKCGTRRATLSTSQKRSKKIPKG